MLADQRHRLDMTGAEDLTTRRPHRVPRRWTGWYSVGVLRGMTLGLIYPWCVGLIAAFDVSGRGSGGLVVYVVFGTPIGLVIGVFVGIAIGLVAWTIDLVSGRRVNRNVIAAVAVIIGVIILTAVGAVLVVDDGNPVNAVVTTTIYLGFWEFVIGGPALLGLASLAVRPLPRRRCRELFSVGAPEVFERAFEHSDVA